MTQPGRVAIVGGGISGLTTALTLLVESASPIDVTVFESSSTTGGLIRATHFAGLDSIDEGADAFLVRVPWAQQLASELGLGATLTSPTSAHAAVWHNGLHSIPQDLLLGIPAKMRAFVASPLISPLGKLRAAIEPLLPRTTDEDSIGHYIRKRFGNQIHERLVDPLVGSIYAADTDKFSMAAVPQIASLTASRSLLLAAARARKTAQKNATPNASIFGSPLRGMGALTETLAQRVRALGGNIVTDAPVSAISRHHNTYVITTAQGEHTADAVAICSPAQHSAAFVAPLDMRASQLLGQWDHASVVLITMAISAQQWPAHLTGSGYLVPKPDQRWVTAASFGSNKWAHWRPDDGSMIVRVSLGRDGLDVMHFEDDALVNLALADMKHHLGTDFTPHEVRISRWKDSFPQYRPHHFARLAELEHSLSASAPGIVFAGASYRGIGVPACVEQARKGAHTLLEHLAHLPK
jgi:protoporphyrinogen/coproporphyrinogen III oxidase